MIGDKPSETHDRMPRKTHEQNTDKSDKLISPPLKLPTSSPDSKATDTTPSPPLRSLSDVNRPSSSDVSDTKNSSSVLSQMKDDIKRTNSFNTPTTSNGDDVSSNSSVLNSSKDDRLSRSSSLGDNHVKMDAYTSWRQQRHTDEQNSQVVIHSAIEVAMLDLYVYEKMHEVIKLKKRIYAHFFCNLSSVNGCILLQFL